MSQENDSKKLIGPVLKKMIITKKGDTGYYCPADMEYCYQCGHVAKLEDFQKLGKCPNPKCSNPHCWDD